MKFCSLPAAEPEEEADGGVVDRHGGKIARPEGRHLGIANLVGSGEVDDEGEPKENERGEYEYIFEAASLRRCAFDHSKICCYCGKCKKGGGKTVGVYLYKNKPKGESKE